MIASYPYGQYAFIYNAADEGRGAESYGEKLIDDICTFKNFAMIRETTMKYL